MAVTFKRPMPSVGVDKYTFFKITEDSADGTVYDSGTELPGTVEIAPSDSGGVEIFEADNGIYDSASYTGKIGHTITNADIPPAVDAAWRGAELSGGLCEVKNGAPTVYFGVAWRILKSDGSYRYVRYYKGTYSFSSNTGAKTKAVNSYSPQTAKAEFTAIMRESDSAYYAYIDESDLPSGVTKAVLEQKWFSDPNWYPAQ